MSDDTYEIQGKKGVYEIQSAAPPTPDQVKAALAHYEPEDDAGPLKRFARGVGRMTIGTDDPYGAFIEHPLESAKGVLRTMRDNAVASSRAMGTKDGKFPIEASAGGPLVTESFRKGDYAGAAGEALGFAGMGWLGAKAAPAAPAPPEFPSGPAPLQTAAHAVGRGMETAGGGLEAAGNATMKGSTTGAILGATLGHTPMGVAVGAAPTVAKFGGKALKAIGRAMQPEQPTRWLNNPYAESPTPAGPVEPSAPPPAIATQTGTGANVAPPTGAGTQPWSVPAPEPPTAPQRTGTGTAVAPPQPAGNSPWVEAMYPTPPPPVPNVGTGTGSAVAPPAPAGTQPWTAPAPPPPTAPEVTGTGSAVGTPKPAGTLPWTAIQPPAGPPPTPPNVGTGTGAAPAGGPVSWEGWNPRGAPQPVAPVETSAPNVSTPEPTAPTAAPPIVAEPPEIVAPPVIEEPPAAPPVRPKREGASPKVRESLSPEDNAAVEDAIRRLTAAGKDARTIGEQLGLSTEEVRVIREKATGKAAGTPPADALARLDAAAGKVAPDQLDAEIASTKNPKYREALQRRKETLDALKKT